MYLQYLHGLSDEALIDRWVESLYFHFFTGGTFFQHRPPVHPSSLRRWHDYFFTEPHFKKLFP
ncbi:MAG: transposase [Marivita sp.]|nr:transposase [Marivita sp.]